jgi:hypothetical protein
MKDFKLDSEELDKELIIDNSSIHSLVEELRAHPRKEAKYQRFAAQASKEVARIELELEVLTAELIDRAVKETNSTSASARQELRKGGIAKYPEYQAKKKELYEAREVSDILSGLVSAWTSRGYRLMEITKITDRAMLDGPRVYRTGESLKKQTDELAEEIGE